MPKFFIETYGCQMNVSDSELITTILTENGFTAAATIAEADIILFNTCSVRENAETRVLGRISNEMSRKILKPNLKIGVIGCMAQRMGERLFNVNGSIDLVVGVDNYHSLPQALSELSNTDSPICLTDVDHQECYDSVCPTRYGDFNAFINITRGCNNFCSYCIVPYVRGRERSRPVDSILAEIEEAGNRGFKDVTLLGQNVNSYRYKGIDFPHLLKLVNQLDAIKRVRFITSHPKDLSDSLITAMTECDKVCEHLHLPIQSGDNDVLRRMNRGYTYEHYYGIVQKLRASIPDISLTADIMVGYPDETEDQFLNTYAAMEQIRYDFAFMFRYSVREGTASSKFVDSVPEGVKLARLDKIISLQGEITLEKYRNQIGLIKEVYVEKVSKKSSSELSGKTRDFKIVVFPGDTSLIGSFVNVKIVDATGWTLKGELIE